MSYLSTSLSAGWPSRIGVGLRALSGLPGRPPASDPATPGGGVLPETPARPPGAWQRRGPILALLLLAPVISEVLFGATRLSFVVVLLPEIGIWGCGALLAREWVRRRRGNWLSLLLLGVALAVAEECIIQQTSVAPLAGLASHAYGRKWGVNWVYLLWALGYESVWVVVIPVTLTELLFPARRNEPWLRGPGMVAAAIAFAVSAGVAWFSWTQVARVKVFHMPAYDPSAGAMTGVLAVILALVLVAARLPPRATRQPDARAPCAPRPWIVGLVAGGFGLPWAALVLLGFGSMPRLPFGWVMAVGIAWVGAAFWIFGRWTSNPGWEDPHRLAAVFGAIAACMLAGFVVFAVGGALTVDWIGKLVLNAGALLVMPALARSVGATGRKDQEAPS